MSRLSHLGLTDELLQLSNLSPDLVLFADEVMDTLGQLLLRREHSIYSGLNEASNSKPPGLRARLTSKSFVRQLKPV